MRSLHTVPAERTERTAESVSKRRPPRRSAGRPIRWLRRAIFAVSGRCDRLRWTEARARLSELGTKRSLDRERCDPGTRRIRGLARATPWSGDERPVLPARSARRHGVHGRERLAAAVILWSGAEELKADQPNVRVRRSKPLNWKTSRLAPGFGWNSEEGGPNQ